MLPRTLKTSGYYMGHPVSIMESIMEGSKLPITSQLLLHVFPSAGILEVTSLCIVHHFIRHGLSHHQPSAHHKEPSADECFNYTLHLLKLPQMLVSYNLIFFLFMMSLIVSVWIRLMNPSASSGHAALYFHLNLPLFFLLLQDIPLLLLALPNLPFSFFLEPPPRFNPSVMYNSYQPPPFFLF